MERPVVIIATYGRSGSTLLSSIIADVAGYHISGENGDALFGLFHSVAALSKAKANAARRNYKTHRYGPWFGIDTANVEAYATRIVDTFFDEVVQAPADAPGIGFKEIRMLLHGDATESYFDFIAKHVKGARIVFNTRDHEKVLKSGWYAKRREEVARRELEEQEQLMKVIAGKHPNHCFQCSYEDYTAEPAALAPLFEFIGAKFDVAAAQVALSRDLAHGRRRHEGRSAAK